ncbi:MAG: M48 family metalloprotease [Proteobacteria bacterium]|nr:M48 family metalloprotease [Pseudomonadota bacterium]MDA1023475.1 M48 family metalloprotease [Pseudomonadota bacterium]
MLFHTSPMMVRLIPLLALLMILAGCAANPATGKQSFTAFMSKEDELRVGAEEHPKLIKEFGGAYTDAKLRGYVRRIGLKLSGVSEANTLPFTFTILNDDKVNAFALPGGYVYITRGLLALAENEAEMASVLAHEIGHVTARHSAERYSTTMATNLGLMVLGVIGSAAGVPSDLGRLVGYGAQAALQGYSREQELEADQLGVRYLARAGYSPKAMTSFFHKMKAHEELEIALQGKEGDARNNIMSTHPRTVQRINQAIGLAQGARVKNPVIGRDTFLAEIDGMVFGDDPEQGVRKGRTFIHPGLRIKFTVPPEFVLFNSPSQVVAHGPKRSAVIFDLAPGKSAKKHRSMKMTDYLATVWGSNLSLRGVERISVNGMQGATGAARGNTKSGPRDVRLVAIRDEQGRIYRFAFITPSDLTERLSTEFRRTTYSFQRITEAAGAAIRPLKVRVTTVRRSDTPDTFSSAMPFEKYRRRWFDILNRQRLEDGLKPGVKIKTVSE